MSKTSNFKISTGMMKSKRLDGIFVAVMLLIPVVHFIIFWGVVNFDSIMLAFQRLDTKTGKVYPTLDNFKMLVTLFKDGELKRALVNTLLTSGFQTIFLLPWAFVLTYFLYKKIPCSGFYRTMLFLPSILPAVAMATIFKYMIHPDGPMGKVWELICGKQIPSLLVDEKYGKWTIIAYYFFTNFGGQFILFSGAMARIPNELIESANLDGANMGVEMFKIVMPLCWPTISMLLLLNISSIFTTTGPVLLLTKGLADTKTISFWIFEKVNEGETSLYLPSALGISCTVILFPIIMVARWLLGKVYADVEF